MMDGDALGDLEQVFVHQFVEIIKRSEMNNVIMEINLDVLVVESMLVILALEALVDHQLV
jgi:hypothetical protein